MEINSKSGSGRRTGSEPNQQNHDTISKDYLVLDYDFLTDSSFSLKQLFTSSIHTPADQNSASRPPLPPRLRSLKSFQEEEEEVLKSINLNGSKDVGSNIMAEMPFVSAEGCGPNGRRVDGFLYNYRRGEEVRIVCICHGSFHTPAEFAGGSVVPHTLRQIVVNPSPLVYY